MKKNNKLIKLNILLCLLLFLFTACGKTDTVVIGNINFVTYMNQLNGVWLCNDLAPTIKQISFITDSENGDDSNNTKYLMEMTDSFGVTSTSEIEDIYPNDDYLKTYTVKIDETTSYSFYMTDSNNIVFEGAKFERVDEFFDQEFALIEGSWTNDNGIKVTFFSNKNNRYVNLTDGFGTFNKRIFDIDKAMDVESGNYLMTKEGNNFINFYYDLHEDGSLSFYDYTLYRNEDTSEYESLQAEEIIEEESEEDAQQSYDLSTHGTKTGYEVADYSGDIPTDTGYIFVGDSRFVGMNTACGIGSRSNQFVVAKISQGYYWLTNEAMAQVDSIISNHAASAWVVIFNLGINDLQNINNYTSFYAGLANKPYKVVLVSVNPVGNYPKIPNSTVEGFNNSLRATGYTYIDTYSYLMNERGYVTPDGLHYSNNTYQDIYRYIIYSVKGIQLSEADRAALENQYHGIAPSSNSASTSNNSASENATESVINTSSNGYSFENIEAFYGNENNSVEFSNRIQNMKASSNGVFSNITVTLDGNTIVYNYTYSIDVPDVDWDSTDKQLESNANQELIKLHNDSGVNATITIGYIYYDNTGKAVHSYYTEG